MKVTLRKLAALQESLIEVLADEIEVDLSVNALDYNPPYDILDTYLDNYKAVIEQKHALLVARANIRALVAKKNVECGISDLLSNMNLIDRQLSLMHQSLMHVRKIRLDVDTLAKRISRKLKLLSFEKGLYHSDDDSVQVSIFTKAYAKEVQVKIKSLRIEKRALSEQLLTLNVQTTVELPDLVVKVLREQNLIN